MTDPGSVPLYMRRAEFDPDPELSIIRNTDGVRLAPTPFGVDMWLVTRYDDVRTVLSDHVTFSNAGRLVAGAPLPEAAVAGNLLAFDPPEHTRLRRMLTSEFTARRLKRLEPRIHDIVTEHLDAMAAKGPPTDLVASFAMPVPALVICELLGVPYADREGFADRSRRMLDLKLGLEARLQATAESNAYMGELVERARAEPGEDLLGMLVREHGHDLSTEELTGVGTLLLLAGHETTSNMLSLGTAALLRHPDQVALLRAEPERVDAAVEELLRWLSVVHSGMTKTVTADVELSGQVIKTGELVACVLPAANRDAALIADPERLDIGRGDIGHVAFGHGVHHCIGAPLARMEMRIAFPALIQRFPGLRAAGPITGFTSAHVVYGLSNFDVEW